MKLQVFGGNMDASTERRHYLNDPVVARFVRVHPTAWNKRIGMRAAILGCPPSRGPCDSGYFRVNEGAACGERALMTHLEARWTGVERDDVYSLARRGRRGGDFGGDFKQKVVTEIASRRKLVPPSTSWTQRPDARWRGGNAFGTLLLSCEICHSQNGHSGSSP